MDRPQKIRARGNKSTPEWAKSGCPVSWRHAWGILKLDLVTTAFVLPRTPYNLRTSFPLFQDLPCRRVTIACYGIGSSLASELLPRCVGARLIITTSGYVLC